MFLRNKKRLQFSTVMVLYCNRAHFLNLTFRCEKSSGKKLLSKVPWLCVTASRRFCRQVLNCFFRGKFCRNFPFVRSLYNLANKFVKRFNHTFFNLFLPFCLFSMLLRPSNYCIIYIKSLYKSFNPAVLLYFHLPFMVK